MPNNNQKIRKRIRNFQLMYGMAGVLASPMIVQASEAKAKNKEGDKIENTIFYNDVEFQYDTLKNVNNTGAYATNTTNTITWNYFEENNCHLEEKSSIVHEAKHVEDNKAQLYTYSMSLEQYYKCLIHGEISANIAALLSIRQKYVESGNFIGLLESDKFDFYVEAISKNRFNPLSQTSEEFEKEMSFIANQTKVKWMKDSYSEYERPFVIKTNSFCSKAGIENLNPDDENYKRSVNICYNMGGIDFFALLSSDVECLNSSVIDADKIIKEGTDDLIYLSVNSEMWHLKINEKDLSDFYGDMSLEQYHKLLQHEILAKSLKERIPDDFSLDDDKTVKKMKSDLFNCGLKLSCGMGKWLVDQKLQKAINQSIRVPKRNDDVYQQRLENVYKGKAAGLFSLVLDKQDYVLEKKAEKIDAFEKTTLLDRIENYFGKKWDGFLSGFIKEKKLKENKIQKLFDNYSGDPIHQSWSPEHRVSEPQKMNIIDLKKSRIVPVMEKTVADHNIQSYDLGNGLIVEVKEPNVANDKYAVQWVDKNGRNNQLDSLGWVDTDNMSGGVLMVNQKGEALKFGEYFCQNWD